MARVGATGSLNPAIVPRPLSARSVVASTLLGTTPPRLPGRLLVAFAGEFGINPGTTRVALTRMVERGELRRVDDGVYELCGELLRRQERQEAGLQPAVRDWEGEWETVVVRSGGRTSPDRAALRRACGHLGLAELREGVWTRPDNLDPDRLASARSVVAAQTDRFVGRPDADPAELAARLFPLAEWANEASRLVAELATMDRRLEREAPVPLAEGFGLAADALRHLVADPLLPGALVPDRWPAKELRAAHGRYDVAYRAELSAFFRARRDASARPTLAS
mgnify:CR=1 FL=1